MDASASSWIPPTSRQALDALRITRLQRLLEHATLRVARYRGLPTHGEKALDDWPMTDRAMHREHFADLTADDRLDANTVRAHFEQHPDQALFGSFQVFRSAGRHGELNWFVYDAQMWEAYLAAHRRLLASAQLDTARIAFVGSSDPGHTLVRVARAFAVGEPRIFGLQQPYPALLAALRAFRPEIMVGYSSALDLLAESTLAGELPLRPRAVLSSTDWLSPEARQRIRRAWAVEPRVFYGTTEMGIMAAECPFGRLHINEDLVLLDRRDGALEGTNLVNRVQPFIRYHLPDDLEIEQTTCDCKHPSRTIVLPSGRINSICHLPARTGGTTPVHPIVLRSVLDDLDDLHGFGLAWGPGRLELRVRGAPSHERVEQAARAALDAVGVAVERVQILIHDWAEIVAKEPPDPVSQHAKSNRPANHSPRGRQE